MGYFDDKYKLSAGWRLCIAAFCALIAVMGGVWPDKITNPFGGILFLGDTFTFNTGSLGLAIPIGGVLAFGRDEAPVRVVVVGPLRPPVGIDHDIHPTRMAGSDGGLQLIGPARHGQGLGTLQRRQAAADGPQRRLRDAADLGGHEFRQLQGSQRRPGRAGGQGP
jgi:hypothetical protein